VAKGYSYEFNRGMEKEDHCFGTQEIVHTKIGQLRQTVWMK
jgi:hypothetical protein